MKSILEQIWFYPIGDIITDLPPEKQKLYSRAKEQYIEIMDELPSGSKHLLEEYEALLQSIKEFEVKASFARGSKLSAKLFFELLTDD